MSETLDGFSKQEHDTYLKKRRAYLERELAWVVQMIDRQEAQEVEDGRGVE